MKLFTIAIALLLACLAGLAPTISSADASSGPVMVGQPACRVEKPTDWGADGTFRWIGRCRNGLAEGHGVLRNSSSGEAEVLLFLGDVRAGRLRSGVLASSQLAGFSGGRWKDGAIVEPDDELKRQNDWRAALMAAADAATQAGRTFQREHKDASATYYLTLAKTLRNQLD